METVPVQVFGGMKLGRNRFANEVSRVDNARNWDLDVTVTRLE